LKNVILKLQSRKQDKYYKYTKKLAQTYMFYILRKSLQTYIIFVS